jgi:hypothetical protein
VIQPLLDYYRIPADLLGDSSSAGEPMDGDNGFFQFGSGNTCFGRSRSGVSPEVGNARKLDAAAAIQHDGDVVVLPFNLDEVIDNLRLERYRGTVLPGNEKLAASELVRKLYYLIREGLPVAVRRRLQRAYFSDWKQIPFPSWPVDFTVDNLHEEALRQIMEASGTIRMPFIWFWPNGAPNCVIMTHDVETSVGRDFTSTLMDLDDVYGIKASFQVIPEKRYSVSDEYVAGIRSRGFEFNIHDLNHDGNLYRERSEFMRRAAKVNDYIRQYGARGFRAGAMYRNQDWYDAFEFSYDMSVPNVAHLEPMRGGCCTVMPYFIGKIVELPLTLAQDYSLFHILNDYSLTLWKQQLSLIRQRNGLMSFISHPDYLIDPRARQVYESLLVYLRELIAREGIWQAVPGDVDLWWRARSQMKLVPRGNDWEILGPDHERATLAYAVLKDGRVTYELSAVHSRRSM